MKDRPLIIVGDSAFAQIAYHYFNEDTNYRVVAFSVEREFLKNKELFDTPVVPFDELPQLFSPAEHDLFVAITYGQLNRLRARLVQTAKAAGYKLASYISPRADVSKQAELGEHCFVFESNVIQPFCKIGNNVILWSGNHIGHHSIIGEHSFISSHVVVSGYVSIGRYCFCGVNATIANNVTIGDDCWLGPAVVINKDAKPGSLFPPVGSCPSDVTTFKFFKITDNVRI